MKLGGNRRKVVSHSGSLMVIIPPALAADKRIRDGTVIEWRTTTDGLLLIPVGQEEPKEKEGQ